MTMKTASSSSNEPLSLRYRVALAFLACLQNSLVGGLLYGWASVIPLLTADQSDGGAGLSLAETTQIFSWASSVGMIATLILGWVLDRFGPRLCSVVSHALIAAGCQLFAASSEYQSFAIACCLVAFGGPGVQVSIVHLANLFPKNQFLMLSLLNGTISFSFAVLAAFDYIWEAHPGAVNFRQLFGGFSLVIVGSLIASYFCWPDVPFQPPLKRGDSWEGPHTAEDDYIEALTAHQHLMEEPLDSYLRTSPSKISMSMRISGKAIDGGFMEFISLKDQPFRKQLLSGTYLRALSCFVITCFLANFYVASISTELADFQDFTLTQQFDLARYFTLIMSGGVVASFIVGTLMDRFGLEICTALTLLLGMVHMVVLQYFSDRYVWMIAGFFVYVMFRQFLFPVFIASLTARLGFKYFGLLNGLGFAASGIMQAFMALLVEFVQGDCHLNLDNAKDCDFGRWQQLHTAEFVIFGLLLLVPFFDHREKQQQDKQLVAKRGIRDSWRNLKLQSSGSLLSLPNYQGSGETGNTTTNYGTLPTHEEISLSFESEADIHGMDAF